MKMKESKIIRFIGEADNKAKLSNEALNDKRLDATLMGYLLYLCNHAKETTSFHFGPICARFNISERTLSRKIKKLIRYGYIQRKHEGMQWVFWISDVPKDFKDPKVIAILREETKKGLGISEPVYKPPSKKKAIKLLDPLTTSPEDIELAQYFMNYGFAIPKTTRQWTEARKPGISTWADITEHALDWIAVPLVNQMLQEPINEMALNKAWQKWTGRNYNPSNVDGILEWYSELCKDIEAEPWNRSNRGKNNHGRHIKSSGQSRKEHGISNIEAKESDYSTIDKAA